MGVHANIKHDQFPKQTDGVGGRVRVCFHYDLEHPIGGTVVRDDAEDPGRTIILLDDGRYVLSIECQHSIPVIETEWPDQL